MTIDFGFIPIVSVGSTLFYDDDDSGTHDAGETGIPGIIVQLHDSAGNLVASTTTDASGDYYFGNLAPGDYQVIIPTPPADAPTSSTLTCMSDNQVDGDDNGSQPTGSGGSVISPIITLTIDGETTNEMTVDFGFIRYVSLGSTLFDDPNDNGIQDDGEDVMPGVEIELRDSDGTLSDSDSDSDDQTDILVGSVSSPVITLIPEETPMNEPGQGGDPDGANDNNGEMTIDFDFVSTVSMGSTIFYDDDDSGTQDMGEAGIPGVLVEFYDTAGFLLGSITTDDNGSYYFDELLAGDYQIAIPMPPVDAPISSTPTDMNVSLMVPVEESYHPSSRSLWMVNQMASQHWAGTRMQPMITTVT